MARKEDIIVGRRLKTSYITTVVSISLVLFVLGLLGLVILYTRAISDHVKENITLSVILQENAAQKDIERMRENITNMPAVNTMNYVSREEAAEQMKQDLGEDFVAFLGYNPLHPILEVGLKAGYANTDSMAIIETRLLKNPIVTEVDYQKDLVHLVNENVQKIGVVLGVFSLLLMLIAFALINNTIRLSVFSRRFLIKSMQLVGATQSFIRRPFVVKGILQGIIGALLAIVLLIFTLYTAQQQIPELVVFQDVRMLVQLFALVIFLGIIISWISTHFAVRKYLKIKTDNLYFY
ncbi:MAG: permease-like cell division protein FtsX [Bacteroidales bacterium]